MESELWSLIRIQTGSIRLGLWLPPLKISNGINKEHIRTQIHSAKLNRRSISCLLQKSILNFLGFSFINFSSYLREEFTLPMAESQKGKTSSVDPKQKNSLFDDDIGKDFMTSWKSLSVAGDDNMDFSFDTVSTGKKKKINFDKVDMDFDLDGDFDKLTSFKMPDLDFTSPSKKTSKLKESSKEESSRGNHLGKKKSFGCSFDFNEFDDFNFDSPMIQGGKTSVKNSESEKVGSERGENQRSKVNLACSDDAFDYCHTKKSRSPEVATSVVETTVLGAATGISSNDNSPSIEKYGDMIMSHSASNPPEKTVSASVEKSNQMTHFLDKAMPEEETISADAEKADHQNYSLENAMPLERTVSTSAEKADQQNHFLQKAIVSTGAEKSDLQNHFLEKAMPAEKIESAIAEKVDQQTHFRDKAMPIEKNVSACVEKADQQNHFPEKVKPTESHSQKTTQISPVESVNGNSPIQDMEFDVQVGSLARKLNIESSAEENVTDSTVDGVGSNHENLQLKNLALLYSNESEGNGGSCRNANSENPTGNMKGAELIRADLDFETTSTANLLQKKPQDSNDIQKSASKNLASLMSEPVVNVTPTKDVKSEVVCSRFFKRSQEPEPQSCQPSSTGMEISSFGCQGNARRESFNVKDAETHKKVTGDSRSLAAELTKGETSLLGTDKNVKNLLNVREDFNSSERQNVHQLITNPRLPERKMPKGDCHVVGSGVNIKILNNLCSEVNTSSSTVKANKSSINSSVNLKALDSSMATTGNSKMISVGALQAVKKTPDLASLKIARPSGASKDHSNAVVKRGLISLRNLEKSVHPIANSERKNLLSTSLKRKTHEASTPELVSLYPQKRLSPSPNQIRHLKESLESTVEEQVCNHDNQAKSQVNDVLRNNSTFGLEKAQLANIREHDISLAMENDGNVEKAEAYAKDLDDICKMLKKKHDEAKDLMVRAIVNNNSLLMLDHPMFNEKIQTAQKFAAQLISNCQNKML